MSGDVPAESAGGVFGAGGAEAAGPGGGASANQAPETSARRSVEAETWLAPPVSHLLASIFDFAVVAVIAVIPGGAVAWLLSSLAGGRLLVAFIVFALALGFAFGVYSAICLWLTEGQTMGKAMLGIAVHRVPGGPPRPDLRGLAWAAGRCLAGYAVIDVLGLGMLMALVTPGRRSVHDYVFDSQVVLAADAGQETAWARLRGWDKRRQDAQAELAERYGLPLRLVRFVIVIVAPSVTIVFVLGYGKINQVVSRLLNNWLSKVVGHTGRKTAAAVHTVVPAAKAAVVVTATAVTATVAATGATAVAASPPSISGTWSQSTRVERTGPATYTGTSITTSRDSATGCVWPRGQVIWRIEGNGPRYRGEDRWVLGSNGQHCTFRWAKSSTFVLRNKGNTLRECSTDPWNSSDRQCHTWRRTT